MWREIADLPLDGTTIKGRYTARDFLGWGIDYNVEGVLIKWNASPVDDDGNSLPDGRWETAGGDAFDADRAIPEPQGWKLTDDPPEEE